MKKVALAIAAHPDDIEFVMSGTLMLLRKSGFEIHYLNLSSGNLGSNTLSESDIKEVRAEESRSSALLMGATWHPPFLNDLEIVYHINYLRELSALIRSIKPTILLTHSPQDYMEDHMCTSRLAVTAAFSRGMPNFKTLPPKSHSDAPIAIYHSQPHMNRDQMGEFIEPKFGVDVSSVIAEKRESLLSHKSQKDWLDASQGIDSYINTMESNLKEVGKSLHVDGFVEGWRPHSHFGYCDSNFKPLEKALKPYLINRN